MMMGFRFSSLKKVFIVLILVIPWGVLAGAPADYRKLSACEKQKVLWNEITISKHSSSLPEFSEVGFGTIMRMGLQAMRKKTAINTDFAPEGWVKYLHRRGVVAKVKFVPASESNPYTGIFKSGAECSLLRLSLTGKPNKRLGFAPGLAWKVLRDGMHSVNVSALYHLEGQREVVNDAVRDDYNFLANPLSNIVPVGDDFGKIWVHRIFSRVTDYPEELKINEFARKSEKGIQGETIRAPRQVFFVPLGNEDFRFSADEHDFRRDFLNRVNPGTELYEVRAADESRREFEYHSKYDKDMIQKFKEESILLGTIVTTSDFVASEFGDTGLLFRHEVRRKNQ